MMRRPCTAVYAGVPSQAPQLRTRCGRTACAASSASALPSPCLRQIDQISGAYRGGAARSAARRRRSQDCRGATVGRCSVPSSNVHAGEFRVQITLAILPPVRGETGSAVVPALGAPIIRKYGKVIRTRLGHRRYRPSLHPPGRRQKVPGTLDVCGLRAFHRRLRRRPRRRRHPDRALQRPDASDERDC